MGNGCAKGFTDGLVTQADTEEGDPAGKGADHLQSDARIRRFSRPG